MNEDFLQADDGTRTLRYGIEQGAWFRGARNCSVIPVIGMLGGALLLLATRLEGLVLVIWLSWLASIPLFFGSVLCLLRYVAMARRDPEGGPRTFVKRFVLLVALLLLHLTGAVGYLVGVILS